MSVKGVLLLVTGNIKDIELPFHKPKGKKDEKNLNLNNNLFDNIGSNELKIIGELDIYNSKERLVMYGFTEGDLENIHELITTDNMLKLKYYGDIIIIKMNKSRIVPIDCNEYESIFNDYFVENKYNESDTEIDVEYTSENSGSEDEVDESDSEDEHIEEDSESFVSTSLAEQDVVISESIDIRDKTIEMFNGILNKEKSIKLEDAIYNYSLDIAKKRKIKETFTNMNFKKIYINKSRSILSNIKKDSYINNTNLVNKIIKGKINVSELPYMSNQELFPEHWKKIMDEKYKRDKMMYEEKEEAMTNEFKCARCKSRECTYYELQTRSADESMTTFITCLNCGNRWKI
jgi:transcription elongation factor S-II